MNEQDSSGISLGMYGSLGGQTARQERRDAAANRTLILETAEKLFAARGVEHVNMADIAQAAGVGKGTLYRRFANKGELCLALMDTQMSEFQNNILGRMQKMTIEEVKNIEQLAHFLEALVFFTDVHSPLLCEVQRAGLLQDIDNTQLQLPHFWQHMTVSGLLKKGVQAGEINPNIDIEYISDALLAPLKADFFRFQREVRGFSLERISNGLRMILEGVAGWS